MNKILLIVIMVIFGASMVAIETNGYLSVKSADGVEILVGGKLAGVVKNEQLILELAAGNYEVTAQGYGFTSETIGNVKIEPLKVTALEISFKAHKVITKQLSGKLQIDLIRKYGTVRVFSIPFNGAQVTINGESYGETDIELTYFPVGLLNFGIEGSNRSKVTGVFLLEENRTLTLLADFIDKKIYQLYEVSFDFPAGVEAVIDNTKIARNIPSTFIGGTYSLELIARNSPHFEEITRREIVISKSGHYYLEPDDKPVQEKMVLVEGGTFTMGDTWGDRYGWKQPTHKVTLTYNFYIGKYETTFDEYDAFCEATGRSKQEDEGWGRGTRPAMNVSWNDSIAYCNWLSEKENLPKAYDNNGNLLDKDGMITTDPSKVVGYRLPTEAEWEYAARGGNKSKGYKYSGSDNVSDVAWYGDNSGRMTQEVGKKAPNELGIYDMSGNVEEWCSDWYVGYSSSVQTNPYNTNPYNSADDSYRVARGKYLYLVTDSNAYESSVAFEGLGLRIAKTILYKGENRVPLAPYNPSPSNKVVAGATSVTLTWDSYDPDGDVMTYDVYFDTNATPTTKVSSSQVENTLNRSNLSYDTTYYWKVVAKDSKVVATEGPVWRFSIQEPPHPTMILVEKGSFEMGDTWGYGASNEKPTHKVTFTYNFYIGKYETTFDEYDAFCETTSRNKPDDEGWGRGIRPVINVSRNDAIAYCNWLSEKEDLPKAYDSNGNLLDKDGNITTDPSKVVGYRLPTEAEWEYASRGGNKSKGYKYFSGSDNVDDVAWYYSNSGSKTQEVGKKAPNELGIYDMSGNAWEWCSDGWYNYTGAPKTNPYNSTAGSYWVIRGGSCYDIATSTRVAYRGRISPSVTFALGFRICRTVPYEGGNRPPLAPYNPIPSDEAVVWATGITLRWDSYEPDDDTMTYDVYFDTNINPTTQVSSNQSETYFSIEALSYNTTYYWKVVAKDNKGGITEGPVWSFKTTNPSHKVFSITYALFSSGIEKVKLVAGSHEIVSSGQRAELEVDWPLDFDTVSIWAVLEDSAEFIGAARVTASSSSRNIPVVSEDGSTKGVIRIELE